MVNGAVDPSQNGKYAAPVMTLAKKIGIPVVLVLALFLGKGVFRYITAVFRQGGERL